MLEDRVREWKEQYRRDGVLEGIEQGSINEARSILRRQLLRRFGEVPAEVEAKLNNASREELECWIDRPYEVETLDAVFVGSGLALCHPPLP